ncbi:hypothetical protein Q7Z49_004260 [Salmonella enterica]|nr:hypothetical protein [Salmonella enterica]
MSEPIDFQSATRNLQLEITLRQEIIILESRALSNKQVSDLAGIPEAAIGVIRSRLSITSVLTRKLARVEDAYSAFVLMLDGLSADAISERLSVGRNIVIAMVQEFLARANWLRINPENGARCGLKTSNLSWHSLRQDAETWRALAPTALKHALNRRNDIERALAMRLKELDG